MSNQTRDDEKAAIRFVKTQISDSENSSFAIELEIERLKIEISEKGQELEKAKRKVATYKNFLDEISPRTSVLSKVEGLELTFRGHLKSIVDANERGQRAAEVAEKLLESGYQYEGKTDLATRVSIDLNAMTKQGVIMKEGTKFYPFGSVRAL